MIQICKYDGFAAELIHKMKLYNEVAHSSLANNYETNEKIDLDKVVKDYKNNKINEAQAYALFAKALELTNEDTKNLSVAIMLAHSLNK